MESLTLFFITSMALIVAPGPDILYVLTRGIADGKWAGILSAMGVGAGILIHTTAAALGLAVLLQTSTYAFWTLKAVGGIYLIYVGYQVMKNRQAFEIDRAQKSMDIKKCFLQGLLSNVLNPKVALFFVAFLPQFVHKNSSNQSLYMTTLGLIFAAMTVLIFMVFGIFAGSIGTWLKEKRTLSDKIRLGSGTIIILLGIRLFLPQKS